MPSRSRLTHRIELAGAAAVIALALFVTALAIAAALA